MATVSADALRARGPFQKSYQWDVSIGDIGFYAQSTQLPSMQIQAVDIALKGIHVYDPGPATPSGVQITFAEVVGGKVSRYLYEWEKACADVKSGRGGDKANAERHVSMTLMGPGGSQGATYKLVGAWPTQINPGPLDSGNPAVHTVGVQLQFDYYEVS